MYPLIYFCLDLTTVCRTGLRFQNWQQLLVRVLGFTTVCQTGLRFQNRQQLLVQVVGFTTVCNAHVWYPLKHMLIGISIFIQT